MKEFECKKYIDFKEEAKQFENILNNYKNTGVQFIDPNFHPKLKIKEKSKFNFSSSKISWRRIDELYNAPLFKKDLIRPEYIFQGSLGDCYFISAITRVAFEPYLVRSFFDIETPEKVLGPVHDSINIQCGAVIVYFYCFGRRTPVLIDTLMPTIEGRKLKFSRPLDNTKSPWFCLVEKAYAKLNGSYSNIESGLSYEAIYAFFFYDSILKEMADLTDYRKSCKMSVFDRIMKYQKQGAVMNASIHLINNSNGVTEKELKNKCLIKNHSYSLLKARKYGNQCFVLLKNPWGKKEWNGAWSKNSPLWTPELKEELEYEEIKNGTFWMSSKDFCRYFTTLSVSKPIHPEWFCRQFCVQLTPGKHDGHELKDKRSRIEAKPNFVFQVTTPIPQGEKCRFHIIVERRSRQIEGSKKFLNYSKYCIFFADAKGKKLNSKNILNIKGRKIYSCDLLSSFTYDVYSNDTLTTIVLNRLKKCNFTEDFYVILYSKFDFKLYNLDNPEKLIKEVKNRTIAFDNYSKKHPEVSLPLVPRFVRGKNVITFANSVEDARSPFREEVIERLRNEINTDQSDASLDSLYPFNDSLNLSNKNKVKYRKETSILNIKSNTTIYDINKESDKIDILGTQINKENDSEKEPKTAQNKYIKYKFKRKKDKKEISSVLPFGNNIEKIIIEKDVDEIKPIISKTNISIITTNKRKQPPILINKPRKKVEFITSDSDDLSSSSIASNNEIEEEIPLIILRKKDDIEPINSFKVKNRITNIKVEKNELNNKNIESKITGTKDDFKIAKSCELNAVSNEDKYLANLLSKMIYEKEKEINKIENQKNGDKNIYCLNMQLEKEKIQFQLLKEKIESDEFDLELDRLSKLYLND